MKYKTAIKIEKTQVVIIIILFCLAIFNISDKIAAYFVTIGLILTFFLIPWENYKEKLKNKEDREFREKLIKSKFQLNIINKEGLSDEWRFENILGELDESPKETKVNNLHRKQQGSINSNSNELNLEKEKSL